MTQTAITRRDLEEIMRDGIEGDPDAVEAVIERMVGETARYEDVDIEALLHKAQTLVIALMQVEDWR